jgi:hypothetical protein
MDLATLQAMMVEVVRKRKAAAHRKQASTAACQALLASKQASKRAARTGLEGGEGEGWVAEKLAGLMQCILLLITRDPSLGCPDSDSAGFLSASPLPPRAPFSPRRRP